MSAPARQLILFCCEGGDSRGYHRAGFAPYGVDLFKRKDDKGRTIGASQSRYPFPSYKGDAIKALERLIAGERLTFTLAGKPDESLGLEDFDAAGASPPCQPHSITKHTHSVDYEDLVEPTRTLLDATGLPYIMENVEGAPLANPVTLCGAAFGLTATDEDGTRLVLRRHRLFESNIWLTPVECECLIYKDRGYRVAGLYGGGSTDKEHAQKVRKGGYTPSLAVMASLVGVEGMTRYGLNNCIPPAYTAYLGEQLQEHLASMRPALV